MMMIMMMMMMMMMIMTTTLTAAIADFLFSLLFTVWIWTWRGAITCKSSKSEEKEIILSVLSYVCWKTIMIKLVMKGC